MTETLVKIPFKAGQIVRLVPNKGTTELGKTGFTISSFDDRNNVFAYITKVLKDYAMLIMVLNSKAFDPFHTYTFIVRDGLECFEPIKETVKFRKALYNIPAKNRKSLEAYYD